MSAQHYGYLLVSFAVSSYALTLELSASRAYQVLLLWSVHSLGLHHIPQQCHFYSVASDVRREAIFESMRHWEEKTCIRFKRRTQERDYVEITDESMQGSQW